MKRFIVVIAILLFALVAQIAQAQGAGTGSAPAPVNPNASPEARALLKFFYSISGKYTLSGQHNYPYTISRWTDRVDDLVGKYPALYGQDFGFSGGEDKDSTEARPELIAEAKRQYENGAVITLTWHAVRPTSDEPVTFRENVQSKLSDFEWNELLTPGTVLNNRWCEQVDVIAGFLKQLRDAHVPVLFRPYHEMNGKWFWWGGRPGKNGSAALYRQIFDRMVNYHKLNNLIWVWNVNATNSAYVGAMADFFPGAQYADLLTVDTYGEFKQSYYDEVLALSGGKPIALGEVGGAPTPAVLQQQPKWTYFMIWSEFVEWENPAPALRALFNSPNVLTRGDPRMAALMPTTRKSPAASAPELVGPNPTSAAKALLARIYSTAGKSVLSGQENTVSAVSAPSEHVFQVTGKHPLIYGADLGGREEPGLDVKAARQLIVDEAKRQAQSGSIVSLAWTAARPTDDDTVSPQANLQGQLSDFEWNELLTPGTNLYRRWCAQVDGVAALLKQLQDAGVAVLWQPYPETNGKRFWWAGRKGNRGSAALYRQLFDRIVNHDGIRNLVWVWDAAAPGSGPDGAGFYSQFFPGLVYVDAIAVNADDPAGQWRLDSSASVFATGKPIGLGLTGKIPSPELFAQQTSWAWFLASPESTAGAQISEPLQKLYADPRVSTRSPQAAATN